MGSMAALSLRVKRVFTVAIPALGLVLLYACSQSSALSGANPRSSDQPGLSARPDFHQVPALNEITARQTLSVQVIDPAAPAAGPGMVSGGVAIGSPTTATAAAGALEWVIYALGPYDAATQPRYLLLDLHGSSGITWIGVSNYTAGAWDWSALNPPASATIWAAIPQAQCFRGADGFIFVALAVFDGASLSFSGGSYVEDPPFSFTASYNRIIDEVVLGAGNIAQCIMSGDGKRVFTVNWVDGGGLVHSMNSDGSNVQSIPLPVEAHPISALTVNYDGSRLFLSDGSQSIYKVEGGTATRLWVFEGTSYGVNGEIHCDAAGEYVYFGSYHTGGISDRDIWRASQAGVREKLVDDDAVGHDTVPGATALYLCDPFISSDGGVVAFTAYFQDSFSGFELFVLDSGGVRQLTTYGDSSEVLPRAVSGDGSMVIFTRTGWVGENTLYGIHPDGSGLIDLGLFSHNYNGGCITSDGQTFFFADMPNYNGVLVDTAAATRYQLSTTNFVNLSVLGPVSMTPDGSRICYLHDFNGTYGVQIVDLNAAPAGAGAPQIDRVLFCPPQFVRTYPDNGVAIKTMVSDPQGLATITGIDLVELINGLEYSLSTDLPLYWEFDPNDNGELGDKLAGDGIFTSPPSRPGGQINALNAVTVRISVQDENGNAFLADTVLDVIGVPAT